MWVQIKNQCTVCRNFRCLYVQVWNLWNKRSRKTIPKKYDRKIYCVVVFVFCKWRLEILVNSPFITSGYWEYFSDAKKVLYLFYVRVVQYTGICTSVPFAQLYEENDKS